MPKPIVVVGSLNLDFVAAVERIPLPGQTLTGKTLQTFFGGKGGNQAVAVARLGYPVHMVGKIGDDDIGERLRAGLKTAGVNTRAVAPVAGTSSGVALIATDRSGQNSIIVIPGANGKLLPSDITRVEQLIRSAAIVLLQLEVPLETVARTIELARKHAVPVMLDPAPARSLPAALLKHVLWLTPNETEAAALCGAANSGMPGARQVKGYAEELLSRTRGYVVLKLGARGAFLAAQNGFREHIPAFQVRAVDSTAAGDAFNGGLAVALAGGRELLDAARFASAVAALSVTRSGAQPSMPTTGEVRSFLRRAKLHRSPKSLV
jgi:ribokinase